MRGQGYAGAQRAGALRGVVNAALEARLDRYGPGGDLVAACRHAVLGPAKRVRSVLLILAGDDLGAPRSATVAGGVAVEYVHAASLILDDLPSMDDAKERRGRPATHVVFGESTAILAAIALLNEAYAVLAELPDVDPDRRAGAAAVMARAVGFQGLVTGQMADLAPVAEADLEAIEAKHVGKTGALFGAALAIAGCAGHVDDPVVDALWDAGCQVGLAFQGYDDLLDRYADHGRIGKPTGLDAGKVTVATLLEREAALAWCDDQFEAAEARIRSIPFRGCGLGDYVAHLAGALAEPLQVRSG